jgi:hypothetical protein
MVLPFLIDPTPDLLVVLTRWARVNGGAGQCVE